MNKFFQRGGLTSLGAILTAMHEDLKAAGFTSLLPAGVAPLTLTAGKGLFVMDSSAVCNPLHATQPWRIRVEVTLNDSMSVVIASPKQITETGVVFNFPSLTENDQRPAVMGHLGELFVPDMKKAGNVFISRGTTDTHGDSYLNNTGITYGYTLSVAKHGVAFCVWENSTEALPVFSTFCVQVPVNKDTGVPLADMKSPIFVVYNCDNTPFKKFVISESDVTTPTKSVLAGKDSVNSAAILNEEEQVAVKLDNKYLVTFPNRVNTERFAYSEELDLIAYTSADVIGEDTVLPITVYGEAEPRLYRALKATGPNNTKMRLLVLQQGAGIPA